MADAGTGAAGLLRVTSYESNYDAAGNWSDVTWAFYLIENGPYYSATHNTSVTGNSVSIDGVGTVWAGNFGFDWGGAGYQTTLIASGTTRVYHAADGTGYTTVRGNMGGTGTSGAGGPTGVAEGQGLTTLKVVPGTPSGVSGARVSDSQATVSWAQSSASNGQPTSNTIRQSVNGGAFSNVVTISPATSATVATAANRKTVYGVIAGNAAGSSSWSADSAPVFTTPAAPTNVAAAKDASLNIVVTFTPNVAFAEHQHVIVHGTVSGGVTTWDGSPLATVAAGTSTYTHATPNASFVHVYKVSAKNTDTAALTSAEVVSNSVQLLAAPNKPTMPVLGPNVDKAAAFVMAWTHNPVDTTGQTAYEVGYSTNGGSVWSTTGKVTSAVSSKSFAANTYTAGQALTVRVRTWGQASTGGADGTGVSPWSDLQTVTFKTRPVVTITSPAGSYAQAALSVQLGFTQAEGATFVSASIDLYQGAALLEHLVSTTRASTLMATRVANGGSYTVKVTVLDSNGLTSDLVSSAFTVAYTLPVAAGVTVTYLRESGIAQIGLVIPAPGAGEAAAVSVTIRRTIGTATEVVIEDYPAAPELTILDMTPTIHGDNHYTVTTTSVDGAAVDAIAEMVTAEPGWAFLSTGNGYVNIVQFRAAMKVAAAPARNMALVQAAGRSRPIALFGQSGTLDVSGSVTLAPGLGATPQEVEAFILEAGLVCYRDPSGRRMFGALTGSVASPNSRMSQFQYAVTEAQ